MRATIPPPDRINGAEVIAYALLGEGCRPTGRCQHRHGERPLGPFAGLAIARYDDDCGFYLYYCDLN